MLFIHSAYCFLKRKKFKGVLLKMSQAGEELCCFVALTLTSCVYNILLSMSQLRHYRFLTYTYYKTALFAILYCYITLWQLIVNISLSKNLDPCIFLPSGSSCSVPTGIKQWWENVSPNSNNTDHYRGSSRSNTAEQFHRSKCYHSQKRSGRALLC